MPLLIVLQRFDRNRFMTTAIICKSSKNWVIGNVSDLKADLNTLIQETPNEIIIDLSDVENIDSPELALSSQLSSR